MAIKRVGGDFTALLCQGVSAILGKYLSFFTTTYRILTASNRRAIVAENLEEFKGSFVYISESVAFAYLILKLWDIPMPQGKLLDHFRPQILILCIMPSTIFYGLLVHSFLDSPSKSGRTVYGTVSVMLHCFGLMLFVYVVSVTSADQFYHKPWFSGYLWLLLAAWGCSLFLLVRWLSWYWETDKKDILNVLIGAYLVMGLVLAVIGTAAVTLLNTFA